MCYFKKTESAISNFNVCVVHLYLFNWRLPLYRRRIALFALEFLLYNIRNSNGRVLSLTHTQLIHKYHYRNLLVDFNSFFYFSRNFVSVINKFVKNTCSAHNGWIFFVNLLMRFSVYKKQALNHYQIQSGVRVIVVLNRFKKIKLASKNGKNPYLSTFKFLQWL